MHVQRLANLRIKCAKMIEFRLGTELFCKLSFANSEDVNDLFYKTKGNSLHRAVITEMKIANFVYFWVSLTNGCLCVVLCQAAYLQLQI